MPNSDMIYLQLLLTYIILVCTKSNIFNIFNHPVPIKKKYIRANELPFTSKELQKTIMKRSRLRNKFLKHRTDTNKKTTVSKEISVKNSWKTLKSLILKILTLKQLLITEVSGGLYYHFLPKIHQKVEKLTSLMIVKSNLVMSSSVRHLINFSLM